ncbi:outer membrane beta-barrel protein [Microscilla marina]|uniref:Uncharacterized protein n=1 Tax=Microscilla marina ATCC 23134 TaxID=313606 RepID=A1ZFV6_MICM2|nr:outer membrane beta-barrel protein [Microscilla marina]EAY30880.1 hypothetical protein M23134_01204 [Microscilla marina ATCC 23134]
MMNIKNLKLSYHEGLYCLVAILLAFGSSAKAKIPDSLLTKQHNGLHQQMQKTLRRALAPNRGKKSRAWRDGVTFLEIGGGAAITYRSNDNNFKEARRPLHFFAEFGNTGIPVSFVLSYNMNTRFNADSLSINPNHLNLSLKYSFLRYAYAIPEWIDAYGFMGVGLWTMPIVRRPDPGATNQLERPLADESGFSFTAGVGMSFRIIDRFALHAQLAYYNGGTDIPVVTPNPNPNPPPARVIVPRRIDAGSLQIQILLSYRFGLSGGKKYVCPTFL